MHCVVYGVFAVNLLAYFTRLNGVQSLTPVLVNKTRVILHFADFFCCFLAKEKSDSNFYLLWSIFRENLLFMFSL